MPKKPMADGRFQELLNRTVVAAVRHRNLKNECHAEILLRYGLDYSETDSDGIIDSLEYGNGHLTIAEIEAAAELFRRRNATI